MKRISDGARARQGGAARRSAGARSPRRRTQGGGSVAIATMTAVRNSAVVVEREGWNQRAWRKIANNVERGADCGRLTRKQIQGWEVETTLRWISHMQSRPLREERENE